MVVTVVMVSGCGDVVIVIVDTSLDVLRSDGGNGSDVAGGSGGAVRR